METHSVERDPMAGERRSGTNTLSTSGERTEIIGHKRTLDVMKSVGQNQSVSRYLETTTKTVEDTSDRTSSEDEQRDHPVAAELPPMVPTKMAAKAFLMTEGIAASKEAADTKQDKDQSPKPTVLEEDPRQQEVIRTSAVACKKSANTKLGKTKMPKKVTAKAERLDRNRKRKAGKEKKPTGISQASAKMLFQCSCQLLRTQALDYDVRARELEERNASQAKEVETWEKRIRGLQRELEEYSDEETGTRPRLALIEAGPATARGLNAQDPSTLSAAAIVETSLPPAIAAAETKLQEELHKRTQRLHEFCKSVPGFIDALDEHPSPSF